MKEITITIRCNNEKRSVPTQNNIILDDLLQQFCDRYDLPGGQIWTVTKLGSNTALDPDCSLEDNGIVDGDTLDLALPTKAG